MGSFRKDFLSSIVTFIAAMPLSLGIAFASGVEPGIGLATAIVGGIIVGLFSGAPLTVSGPAAGLSAIVFSYVQQFGLSGLYLIGIIAGFIQIMSYLLRLGKVFVLVPNSVLEGMLGAIGLTIMLGQVHVIFGQKVPTSVFQGLITIPQSVSSSIGGATGLVDPVVVVGMISICIYFVWQSKAGRHQIIPAALPTVVVATVLSLGFEMPRINFSEHLFSLQFSSVFQTLKTSEHLWGILIAAFALAAVASAESLLTARAADIMAGKRDGKTYKCNLDRELFAQGLGNISSCLVGGIPVTAVMVRTAANIQSGAVTRLSTILHGLWILLATLFFTSVLAKVPLVALAAVLIPIGLKLLNLKHLLLTLRKSPLEGIVWLLTLGGILATDLLKGLTIGIAAAALLHLHSKSKTKRSAKTIRSETAKAAKSVV